MTAVEADQCAAEDLSSAEGGRSFLKAVYHRVSRRGSARSHPITG